MAFDAESGLYSAYYNPYHLSRIQAEIEASARPAPERRCVCCLLMFGATCGAVTVAVGFYVRTPAITWPVVAVGLLGVIVGMVLAHRQATGRGWRGGSASIYRLGALMLRGRQQREEEEEEERRQAEQVPQALPPWQQISPLQPWRVAQVYGSRYHMPVYCACPLDDEGSSSDCGSGSYEGKPRQPDTAHHQELAAAGAKGAGSGSGRSDSLHSLSSSNESGGGRGAVSEVGAANAEGAEAAASGSGSNPTTSSSSASSRGSSTQDLAGQRGGAGMAAGGAGPGPGLVSVCGWAGEGAMVCGLPQAGLDGRIDVRPVLVLQPHWQHPAQAHRAQPHPAQQQQHPQQQQQHPAPPAVPLPQQAGPEAQPAQLPLPREPEEEGTGATSEDSEDGGPAVASNSNANYPHHSGDGGDSASVAEPQAVDADVAAAATVSVSAPPGPASGVQ